MASLPDIPRPVEKPDLQDRAEELGIKYFIAVINTFGMGSRAVMIPRSAIRTTERDGWMTMGIFDLGSGFDEEDLCVLLDPTSLVQLPWKPDYAWIACYVYFKGKPYSNCPRRALLLQIENLETLGLVFKSGFEVEFQLIKQDKFEPVHDLDSSPNLYQDPHSVMRNSKLLERIIECMETLGWGPYQAESEFNSGQYEINYKYTTALEAADRFLFLKFMIRELAHEFGARAIFMPFANINGPGNITLGNGLHINSSLWSSGDDVSIMADEERPLGMTDVSRHFLAGIMKHIQALTALACPTVNSYKRLFCGYNFKNIEAWSVDLKYVPLRIVTLNGEVNRLEFGLPDCAANAYLLLAAMIAAGMDGIKHKLEPLEEQRVQQDLFNNPKPDRIRDMPRTLEAALDKLEKNEYLQEALGPGLVGGYIRTKVMGLQDFYKEVTAWEIRQCDTY